MAGDRQKESTTATVDSGSGTDGDYGQDLCFGTFLTPSAADPSHIVGLARAAELAGLDQPREIRRLYNLDASDVGAAGVRVACWAEQLADLTLACGISTFLLAVDDLDGIRRFGAEVAPAVRELVAAERGPTADRGQA